MQIFLNNADSYLGRAMCPDLLEILGAESQLVVTTSEEVSQEVLTSLGVARVAPRGDQEVLFRDVLSSSLIIYDMHSANLNEVEDIIKYLKVAELDHETVFVLVSSVNVWSKTHKEYELVGEEGEEEAADGGEDGQKEVKKRPKALTDADVDKRLPSPAYEDWKYLETLALSLGSKKKLRPHVVAAGILYGNGETVFNQLFKDAWLTRPTHSILAPGDNYVPCVHVRDVARLVAVVARDSTAGRYLLAVDKAKLTQADIVQGIVNRISSKREVPILPPEEVESEFKEAMSLDLIFEPSGPMRQVEEEAEDPDDPDAAPRPGFPWWSEAGLVANLDKVAAEFCKVRDLRPIKMVVTGPPGSGAERLCEMVAERYLHEDPPHLTYEQIVADAIAGSTSSAVKLRRKVARLERKGNGAKLPLPIRTKLVKQRLLTNVCRYRGYVLEGYPTSYQEAEALFTELVPDEDAEPPAEEEEEEAGEEPPEGEEEEEEEEEAPAAPADEDEDGEGKPKTRLVAGILPEFAVVLQSTELRCKERIFHDGAKGASSEEEFLRKMEEYRKANLAEDGSPGTGEFFAEVAGLKVLHVDADTLQPPEAFQAMRSYMEAKGKFFNYLRSDEEIEAELQAIVAERERQEAEVREQQRQDLEAAEERERRHALEIEKARMKAIKVGEDMQLQSEATPLRQYLLAHVVPTLSDGLTQVCREQPPDPVEFLAQYLFAHAQDIRV